jgi:hypothetical protein
VTVAGDPKSATKVDEVAADASRLMRWAVSECQHRALAGRKLLELTKDLPLKEMEDVYGLRTFRKLERGCRILSAGELAINSWTAVGEQLLANRAVNRITDQVERRNALIKSFSPGGSHYKTHEHDIGRLKAARQEKQRIVTEMKDIESRLSQSREGSKSQ